MRIFPSRGKHGGFLGDKRTRIFGSTERLGTSTPGDIRPDEARAADARFNGDEPKCS
jgi:hypothetical protein